MKSKPSPEYLRSLFTYDADSGILRWRETRGSRARAGEPAGGKSKRGHLMVGVNGVQVMVHQVALAMLNNAWPSGVVRHANGDSSDNRLANLQAMTKQEAHAGSRSQAITPENVHAIFRYDDGTLYWRESLSGKHRIEGQVAGGLNADGYVKVEAGGKSHGAHRLVWLMHRGEWPAGEIDHINGNRADNRICNLRDVDHRMNTENRRSAQRRSTTGFLGVALHQSGRFRARIRVAGKSKSLGLYDTPEAAHAAYVDAKRLLHAGNTL